MSVSETYINLEPQGHQGPAQSGFGNTDINLKYVLYENAPHEAIFSIGSDIDLGGTGSKSLGVESYTSYTPLLYFGKGLGDLPDTLKYVKPFAITGTLGYDIPTEASDPNAIEWGLAVEYSLLYLQEHVEDIGLPKPLRNMIPLVEFNMDSPVNRGSTTTTGTINPGVLWEQPDYQIGAEAVIPAMAIPGKTSVPSFRCRSTSTICSQKSLVIPFSAVTKIPKTKTAEITKATTNQTPPSP